MKDRLKQLAHIKQVPQKPAISVDSWDEHATFKICEQWREGQARQPSVPGLARLAALNFERAQASSIPEDKKDQRLLPEGASEAAYYQAMIETFLKTVGIEDKDVAATLESCKKASTGGLHRQPVTPFPRRWAAPSARRNTLRRRTCPRRSRSPACRRC